MTGTAPAKSSFVRDLRTVLAGSGFRKLYTTRLISQTGDGIFTAGLGAYVFFNAQTYPNPAAAAVSFAVLYLPYSLIGPFAGVFIDRWSRRQIMLWSASLRGSFAALTAMLIWSGTLGPPIWLCALVVLGVNRFFLSALSAALPHVVVHDELVMANSVGPTSGTVMGFVGAFIGVALHSVTSGGAGGSAITLLLAGVCYLLAGLSATRMARDALGPDRPAGPESGGLAAEIRSAAAGLRTVAIGLVAGLRHAWHRPHARAALAAIAAHRFLYGILALMTILLYRNYFYAGSSGNASLWHFASVGISSGIGYGLAAVITPVATGRMAAVTWITALLAAGGVVTGALGISFHPLGFVVIGFALGLVAQGITICTTTILQREMADDFRGRVFSINDMLYNGTFALGAAICAVFVPVTGKSALLLVVAACGYLAAAAGYWIMAGQPRPGSPAAGRPAASAQSSSS